MSINTITLNHNDVLAFNALLCCTTDARENLSGVNFNQERGLIQAADGVQTLGA